ncbi:MAG: phosphatidate cytidylyltransferase [Leptospiraceae bacterium]|nr:phosphatidate cytidylyltransferase [Leptospiraceae bacterium]
MSQSVKTSGSLGETGRRIISGLILAAFFVFSFNYNGFYYLFLFLFVIFFAYIAIDEFYAMVTLNSTHKPYRKTGIAMGIFLITAIWIYSVKSMYVPGAFLYNYKFAYYLKLFELNFHTITFLTLFALVYAFVRQLLRNKVEGAIYSIGATMLGLLYIPLAFSHLFLLNTMPDGTFYIWLVAWATVMSDTAAYFSGRTFGKHKVGFAVSPNKTWEGYIGGLILQTSSTLLFYFVISKLFRVPEITWPTLTIFAMLIYIVSVIGDLSESLIKRDSGVKDSGKLIPGHGGVLDLVDALMLTIPGSYYYIIFVRHIQNM